MMVEKVIKNVLELSDVDGACIFDKKGVILHNALPSFFLDDYLEDLSRRITALYEAVDENYVPCEDYLLKFPDKYLLLRRSRHIFLIVAVDPSVNLVSLRMVTNLVLKHITPKVLSEIRAALLAQAEKTPTQPETTENTSAPEAPKTTPDSSTKRVLRPRPTRSFRGSAY